ncbi:receptor-like protein 7 [Rosa rugosa]|uniref:receptor-like protein 7 n=1 Tax=Rosa rugosa TaxID=74645 RepID=UPI002B40F929|nr:receptor-like protein 7 [Rosa rugosa]XP_062002943.1 receptor-like protein 7 [Rosa rugosa]XP_062002944.1 receptor-like protein 7 [Rosa rugosa]XP_062002945.1 receptor-like protein 7 [Rosa rugosa]XP_062002947.1 receptor-like protein 7 [Rosa rugosa]XP_062002948.1 receptor-like protein 7 [Rosa rugosa]XP_062002949.1 receptor-like protein 7 [Rosa rugosa]XP_062002950.1 receptor-like protein 7 [Rosa rugosa]
MPTLFLHFFLFLFTTTVTNLIPAVHSNCIEAQKQSLLHFKKSLVIDSSESSKLITWNSSTDCCSWLGVNCSTNGRVVGLDLSRELVPSSIHNFSSLFQLQHLQSLNLAYTAFTFSSSIPSSIPSGIGKFANLRYLNLSRAVFIGEIPTEIARLTRLKVLDLSRMYSGGQPNLGTLIQNLTELTELNLDDVNLSEESHWSQTISSSLPKLSVLTLSYCRLSGPIHESFARLHSLSTLILDGNNISGPVPKFFANFSSLISLSLSESNFHGAFPKEIFQVPTLQSVDLSANSELRGSLPEFPKNGSLESLVLSGTKFSGVLPDSIGNLKMLSELDLRECNFTGAVPKSLANLTQLGHLYLSSNKFSSPINSIQWDKLLKLVDLDLSDNLLYGSIPLSPFSIPLLQRLDLSGNNFSGQLLEFSNVSSSSLLSLDLSSNNLEGSIPVSILNLPKLDFCNLYSNNLSGFPFYGLQESRNLSFLDLSYNSLLFNHSGTNSSHPSLLQIKTLNLTSNKLKAFPSFLKNQSYLTELDLSNNQIPGQIPNWIWKPHLDNLYLCCNKLVSLEAPLPGSTYHLSNLDLHSNQIQGQIPLFVRGDYLDYSRNNFSSSMPTDIGHFISPTYYLSLSGNNLNGEIPKSICNASGRVLDLSNNSFSGIIPQCLTQTSSLKVLDLRRNNLTGSIPDTFLEDCQLQTLALGRNQIQGQFPKSLANCSTLQVLDLGINQVTDAFPCPLKTISTLSVLILRSNKFYGPIGCPETSGTWPQLQIIDLAHNSFNGEIPGTSLRTWQAMMVNDDSYYLGFGWGVGRRGGALINYGDVVTTTSKGLEMDRVPLSSFTSIDFSANKFTGTIPKEIGQLASLHVLNLSSNAFTGEIPSSFGNMRNIESLDLSQNHLSGQIPPQLADLTFLSYLNVSYNQLTGRIPTSNQFSTFLNTSFEGNKGLWWPPLTSNPTFNGSSSNSKSGDEIDWNVISAEIGFTCGFGIAVGSLLFCKRWRKWYYRAMFKILFKIFPQLEHRFGNHRRHVYINQRYWRRLNG